MENAPMTLPTAVEISNNQQQSNALFATTTIKPTMSPNAVEVTEKSQTEENPESSFEAQNPTKRSPKPENSSFGRQEIASKPMLLNPGLIDKLMSNKTLVNLMSSQLKRVIDTETLDDEEKRRIVRQVFNQMMDEKVDFSMNNVRLAVKTVSSSYRAAAIKQKQQRQQQKQKVITSVIASPTEEASKSRDRRKSRMDLLMKSSSSFGKRAAATTTTTAEPTSQQPADRSASGESKSFPVIDTALKLTKQARSTDKKNSVRVGAGNKLDASGNPIVVVLLPQDKKA